MERYRKAIPELTKKVKEANAGIEQALLQDIAAAIRARWTMMMKRRPSTKRPHWNISLRRRWEAMGKARRRGKKSDLSIEWLEYETKRKSFEEENRKMRRRFAKSTEEMPQNAPTTSLPKQLTQTEG